MDPELDSRAQCVLVFLKVPQKVRVKTLLSEVLGQDVAANLYKNFVADILELLNKGRRRTILYFYPSHALADVVDWLGRFYPFQPQKGDHLGHRMANAFADSFARGFRQVLLIGTDFPDLPDQIIAEAFDLLPLYDAVIGPAADGGYYLIGFNADTFLPETFDHMPWGTASVFNKTLAVFENHRLKFHQLPKWRDIDTYEDLLFFLKTCSQRESTAAHTAAYLQSIDLNSKKI